jgi:DNA-binding NtrC family response regulator
MADTAWTFANLRVLIVEDEEDLRVEMVEFLRRRHEVAACGTVQAAYDALTEAIANAQTPDVVLCDVGLTDGDGSDIYLEFAARLPNCRWIMISGYIQLDDLANKMARVPGPAPTNVEKPVSLRLLQQLILGEHDSQGSDRR